jgi:hypothetical protein
MFGLAASTVPYMGWFLILLLICVAVYYKTQQTVAAVNHTAEFVAFQKLYTVVYLIMMMADWMQGPYVYALYDKYGFSKGEIGQLFIAGFGSSMCVGPFFFACAAPPHPPYPVTPPPPRALPAPHPPS